MLLLAMSSQLQAQSPNGGKRLEHSHNCFPWLVVLVAAMALLSVPAFGQLKVTSVERLNLDPSTAWGFPRFSPDGRYLYFTTDSYDGIWRYSLAERTVEQITNDPKSGYGFLFSPDGAQIVYRRTFYTAGSPERTQEVIVINLRDRTSILLDSQRSLSLPAVISTYGSVGPEQQLGKSIQLPGVSVLGIEDTKIVLSVDGSQRILDPFGDGSYIWPSLSPDGTRLVAYEMSRGAFVCDLDGQILARLGKRNAPGWTHDGSWVVYMDDRDDGHRIFSSELFAVSPDGTRTIQLTNTPDIIKLYPACSPTEKKIAYATLEGQIHLLTYEEEKQ